jgi:hypothetical protein
MAARGVRALVHEGDPPLGRAVLQVVREPGLLLVSELLGVEADEVDVAPVEGVPALVVREVEQRAERLGVVGAVLVVPR